MARSGLNPTPPYSTPYSSPCSIPNLDWFRLSRHRVINPNLENYPCRTLVATLIEALMDPFKKPSGPIRVTCSRSPARVALVLRRELGRGQLFPGRSGFPLFASFPLPSWGLGFQGSGCRVLCLKFRVLRV